MKRIVGSARAMFEKQLCDATTRLTTPPIHPDVSSTGAVELSKVA
jgi:hypothetical protein